jgi:hypothetical protein
MNPHAHLTVAGLRQRQFLHLQNFGAAVFGDDNTFHVKLPVFRKFGTVDAEGESNGETQAAFLELWLTSFVWAF